jgi:hypothetical protein
MGMSRRAMLRVAMCLGGNEEGQFACMVRGIQYGNNYKAAA